VITLAIGVLACGAVAAHAQVAPCDPYSGHSVAGGVRLLGIEPDAETRFGSLFEGDRGRVTPVQYPLDNRSYSGPDPETPQGYPMYAPGVHGIPRPGGANGEESAEDGWVRLGQLTGEGTWIAAGGGSDALGIVSSESRAKLEFPGLPMLTATPRMAGHLLNGPEITDLPSRLFDASVETVLSLPVRDGWFVQAALSPSVFTDGENLSGDALRLPGRLLVFWSCTEKLTLSGGVVYLDREDVSVLPSAGVIWKPSDVWRIEAIMPRPRVAWRYDHDARRSRWLYLVGEFGGGSWAIERAAGFDDVATLSDYRCLAGWEQVPQQGLTCRVEGGLVFNRSLEYSSGGGEIDLPATGLVRVVVSY
jgi:hypothetical protein